MTKQARNILKQYFQDGDTPNEAEFGHLIDSQLNLEDEGTQIVKGTISASGVNAGAFSLEGLSFQTVSTTVISGSNQFGSQSATATIGVTSHSFFGPIHQSSSGADSASYFLSPVNFGTTTSPMKGGGIYIEKSPGLGSEGALQNPLSQSISASILISGSGSHIAVDNHEIHQYGHDLHIKSYSDTADRGNIIFETGPTGNDSVSQRLVIDDEGDVDVKNTFSVNDTQILDLQNNNNIRGPFNPIVASLQNSGKCLQLDTEFWESTNGLSIFNQSGSDNGIVSQSRILWSAESASAFNSSWGVTASNFQVNSVNPQFYRGWSRTGLFHDVVSSSQASANYSESIYDYSRGVPNSSGYVVKMRYNGSGNAGNVSPNLGGFVQTYPNPQMGVDNNQMNHTYVQIFKGLLPSTHEFVAHEGSQGQNSTSYWLTSNKGTGKWEWYARVDHVGDSQEINTDNSSAQYGHFTPISSSGYVSVKNTGTLDYNTPSTVTYYLASCTVYDMTEADALTHRRIGIGTVSPEAALHVVTPTTIGSSANPTAQSTSSAILISNDFSSDNAARQHLAIDNNEIHQFGNDLHITSQGSNGATGEGNIKFRTTTNSDGTPLSDTNTRLYISASGNVGVGNITPGHPLTVEGNISSSGTIYADAINAAINPIGGLKLNDNEKVKLGNGDDLQLYHDGTDSYINNTVGDFYIQSSTVGTTDMILKNEGVEHIRLVGATTQTKFTQAVDMLSSLTVGGITNITDDTDATNFTGTSGALRTLGGASIKKKLYVGTDLNVDGISNLDTTDINGTLNVSNTATFQSHIELGDSDAIKLGAGADLTLQHNGSNTYISNNHVGDFYISNYVDDKDLIFRSDDGSGGVTEYFRLDGSTTTVPFAKPIDITNTTDATSDDGDNGALRCEGGASIAKKLYVGGTIYQDTTPIISPNVTTTIFPHQGYMGGGTTQIYAVVGDTTHHMSGQITLKTQNPKLLITIQLAMGDDNGGVNKVHIKPQHFGRDIQGNWNGGWNSGSYTNSNEWLYGGIASNSDNDGELYNISLNNFLYPMFVDNPSGDGFGPGDTVSIGVFINSEKDIYVNRGDSTSTHFYGNANSYITIQEIPQPGG